MYASRNTHPMLHHGNLVRAARGREPVRDVHDRLAALPAVRTARDFLDGVEDMLLCMSVERRCLKGQERRVR